MKHVKIDKNVLYILEMLVNKQKVQEEMGIYPLDCHLPYLWNDYQTLLMIEAANYFIHDQTKKGSVRAQMFYKAVGIVMNNFDDIYHQCGKFLKPSFVSSMAVKL